MPQYGLVLAGGGGKGAYQIGVWQALQQFDIASRITVVAGTSIGSLNAALFMQRNLEVAQAAWSSISPDKVLTLPEASPTSSLFGDLLRKLGSHGFFTREGLEALMDRYLDFEAVRTSPVHGAATCVPVTLGTAPEYFPLNGCSRERLRRILLASSAIPFVFPAVEIDGTPYSDGGLLSGSDNVPVRPVYEAGCKMIFVVHLDREQVVHEEEFPGATLIQVVPSEDLGASSNFSSAHARRLMQLGYRDMCDLLGPVMRTAELQLGYLERVDRMQRQSLQLADSVTEQQERRRRLREEIRQPLSE